MAITVKHNKVSTVPDGDDTSVVRPSDWNADHTLTGLGTMAEQNSNNVNITGGSITGVSGLGDVTGPASATDNAVARFDQTTGKLIQNSVTTIDDTGNASGILSQQFSNGSAVALAAGKFWYNGSTGSWNAGMGGGLVTQQIGEELYRYGKASAAITDSPLQLVYKTGVVGASGVITFAPAVAGITRGDDILGCATEPIAHNGFGRITTYGIVNNITTNGTAYGETWVDNDDIYYNPVTGGLTKTIPTAPNLKLLVGTVINAGSGGSGSFIVKLGVATYLSALSDVTVSGATSGQQLVYNGTIWTNSNAPTISGGTINNTTIGATTPSTGAFTDLTASGTTTLGANGSNNQTFLANPGTGAFPWVQTSHASGEARIRAAATSGAVTFSLSSLGSGTMRFYTDAFTNEQFRIARTASTINYVQVTGSALGIAPVISVQGTDTNIPLVLQPKGTGALQAQQTDSTTAGGNVRGANAVDWQTERNTAAQVASASYGMISGGYRNTVSGAYSTIGGGFSNIASATGCGVFGGNANSASSNRAFVVGGQANTAGGFYNFIGGGWTNSGTTNAAVTTQSGTMNATTAVTLSGSNANIRVGQYITGTSIDGDTYVAAISGTSLTLSKNASGSSTSTLSFFTPHGVVVGGGNNQATGSYSFIGGGGDAGTAANRNVASGDWSAVAGGWGNQATGLGSVVGGGGVNTGSGVSGNTSSGISSFVGGGISNTASGTYSFVSGGAINAANAIASSVVGGYRGTTRSIQGNVVFPASITPISNTSGVSQAALLILGVETTDATATALRSNTSAASTTNQVILPNNSAYFFTGEVVSGVTGGGNTKGWTIEGVIKRGANAASTALVGTPTVTSMYADVGAATWAIAVTADTTNGGIRVTFTGQASTTIRTVCQIRTTEMTY